jgi:hypothetical protein
MKRQVLPPGRSRPEVDRLRSAEAADTLGAASQNVTPKDDVTVSKTSQTNNDGLCDEVTACADGEGKVALLHRAKDAGLRLEFAGDKLVVRGPKHAGPVVKVLAEHKAEVLRALAAGASATARSDAKPLSRERTVPVGNGRPGLRQPCAARRGRIEELPDGSLLHFCTECGAWGAFGYGVNMRAGRPGRWFCAAHRPQGTAP